MVRRTHHLPLNQKNHAFQKWLMRFEVDSMHKRPDLSMRATCKFWLALTPCSTPDGVCKPAAVIINVFARIMIVKANSHTMLPGKGYLVTLSRVPKRTRRRLFERQRQVNVDLLHVARRTKLRELSWQAQGHNAWKLVVRVVMSFLAASVHSSYHSLTLGHSRRQ